MAAAKNEGSPLKDKSFLSFSQVAEAAKIKNYIKSRRRDVLICSNSFNLHKNTLQERERNSRNFLGYCLYFRI
jgi:hypothetical protein